MAFLHLSTFGKPRDPDQCFLGSPPEGMGLQMYRMGLGDRTAGHYPEAAKIFLREEHPGIRLTSLLGNIHSYLIVCSALKAVIERHCEDLEVEYLPFDLHDHRRRLYSKDYWIINPIGGFDCLDLNACEILRGNDGSVLRIMRYALHGAKLANAPSLFRIDQAPTEYVVDERLAGAILAGRFSNVLLSPFEVSAA